MVQTPLPLRIFLTEYAHPLNLTEEGSSPLNSAKGEGSRREVYPRSRLSAHYNFIVHFEKMRSVPFKYFCHVDQSAQAALAVAYRRQTRPKHTSARGTRNFLDTGGTCVYRNRSPAARLKTAVYAGGAVPRAA
jgi:hypothetical protein